VDQGNHRPASVDWSTNAVVWHMRVVAKEGSSATHTTRMCVRMSTSQDAG